MQEGVAISERDYFKEPFSEAELWELAALAPVDTLFARRSPALKQLGVNADTLAADDMLRLMLQEPKLVRRPLIRCGSRLWAGGSPKIVAEVVAAAR